MPIKYCPLWKIPRSSTKYRDYCQRIIEALGDATRWGRPAVFTAEQVVQLIALACEVKDGSDGATSHWTRSDIVREAVQRGIVDNISASSVGRFLTEAKIKPHKDRYWLNSNPEKPEQFDREAEEVCHYYAQAPTLHQKEVRLCSTDEKSGIQALQRSHPTLP